MNGKRLVVSFAFLIIFFGILMFTVNAQASPGGNQIIDGLRSFFDWLFTAQFTIAGFTNTVGYFLAIGIVFYTLIFAISSRLSVFKDNRTMAIWFSVALAVIVTIFTPFGGLLGDIIEIGGFVGFLILIALLAIGAYTTLYTSHFGGSTDRAKSREGAATAEVGKQTGLRREKEAKVMTKITKQELSSLEKIKKGVSKRDQELLTEGMKEFEEELNNQGTILASFSNLQARAQLSFNVLRREVNTLPASGRTPQIRNALNEVGSVNTAVTGLNARSTQAFTQLRDNYVRLREHLRANDRESAAPLLIEMRNTVSTIRNDEQEVTRLQRRLVAAERQLRRLLP